jgi:hypothetical protein
VQHFSQWAVVDPLKEVTILRKGYRKENITRLQALLPLAEYY